MLIYYRCYYSKKKAERYSGINLAIFAPGYYYSKEHFNEASEEQKQYSDKVLSLKNSDDNVENLAEIMAEKYRQHFTESKLCKPDLIVVMPSHTKGKWNSHLVKVGELLSKKIKIEFKPHLLRRIKDIKTQHECQFEERVTNATESLEWAEPISSKTIMVIDDVKTTGSNLLEAKKSLPKGNKLFGFVLGINFSPKDNKDKRIRIIKDNQNIDEVIDWQDI